MYKDPPIHPKKGQYHGVCNRTACQLRHTMFSPISWYNRSTRAYYCERCAELINGYAGNCMTWNNTEGAPHERFQEGDPLCVNRDPVPLQDCIFCYDIDGICDKCAIEAH